MTTLIITLIFLYVVSNYLWARGVEGRFTMRRLQFNSLDLSIYKLEEKVKLLEAERIVAKWRHEQDKEEMEKFTQGFGPGRKAK